MDYLSPFNPVARPWEIADRLERMRYLINHLVWRDSVCQALAGDEWAVFTGGEGHRLIALWPDEDCAIRSLNTDHPVNFKLLSFETIEGELFSKMYEDELIAAFPDPSQEYEMLTVDEFNTAMRFSFLLKRGHEQALTQVESEELASFMTP